MTFRQGLMLFTAGSGLIGGLSAVNAWGQAVTPQDPPPAQAAGTPLTGATTQSNVRLQLAQAAQGGNGAVPNASSAPGGGANPSANAVREAGGDEPIADVIIKKRELLLKQKDVPSGITEIGTKEIQAVGETGSIQSLLQQSAPSVNVYQQGLGQDVPVISVRGVRGAELAVTLDGVPTQDLISGGTGSFLSNNIGSPFAIDQISGVTVQPGVSAPGVQGFGTIGGTLAYNSKRPTDDRYFDVFGGIGSFGTDHYGIEFNSGKLYDDPDALKTILRYDRGESAGYIDYTNEKYRDLYFAADKPYDNGLSNVGLTFIYNSASGYLQPAPSPVPTLATNGQFWNYSHSESFFRQDNDFLTTILSDDTYLADWVKIGGKAFYIRANSDSQSYVSPSLIGGDQNFQPNFQVPFFPDGQIGPGTRFFNQNFFTYDPSIFGNPSGLNADGSNGHSPQGFGENAEVNNQLSQTYGIKPEVNFFLPYNNIRVGALIVREQQDVSQYVFGQIPVPQQKGYNELTANYQERQLYEGYIQDRIDLFNNTLHIEPGFTYEGAEGRLETPFSFIGLPGNGAYSLARYDREALPYVGASYDLPFIPNTSIYSSWGRSALFAPLSDYALSSDGGTAASGPERLTAVEVGAKYNTDRLYLNVDYFNQRVTRAFSFYANYITQVFEFANGGIEEFKGFEASFKYKITPEIGIFGAGSHLLAKYLQSYSAFTTIFEDQFGYGFKGTGITGVPDFTFNVGVDYDKKNVLKEGDESYLRFYTVYTGQQYTTYDISPSAPAAIANPSLAAATVTNTGYKLSAYAIFNLSAHYSLPIDNMPVKKLDFQMNVQNLFDQHYKAYFYNQYVSYAGIYGGLPYSNFVPGAPFVITFDVTARF